MSDARIRAEKARRLIEDRDLNEVLEEIRQAAAAVFLNASATPEAIAAAHQNVRAVETLRNALNARLLDHALREKREQHRGHD